MKKILCFSAGCIICLVPINGYTASGECAPTTCPTNIANMTANITGCESAQYECYKLPQDSYGEVFYTTYCNKCASGYTLIINPTYQSGSWSYGTHGNSCSSFTYMPMTCQQNTVPCTGCTDCTTTNWVSPVSGYQVRTVKTCNCNTCKSESEFRCAKGYYGTPTTVGAGCTRCPTLGDKNGTTESAGTTGINACIFPANTAVSDDTGTYEFTTDCQYKVDLNRG